MTLRIMLVGLVTSLGLELPSGADVSSWAEAQSTWVRAAMLDQSATGDEAPPVLAQVADRHQAGETPEAPATACPNADPSDAAFEAASGAMTADLAADLLASLPEEAPAIDEAEPALALEAPSPAEDESVGCLAVAEAGDEMDERDEVAFEAEPTPTVDRVSSAVRLTREAVQAWVDVLQQDAEAVDVGR